MGRWWREKMYRWHQRQVKQINNPRMVKVCPCGEFCSNCGLGIPEDIVKQYIEYGGMLEYRKER